MRRYVYAAFAAMMLIFFAFAAAAAVYAIAAMLDDRLIRYDCFHLSIITPRHYAISLPHMSCHFSQELLRRLMPLLSADASL